MNYDAHFRLQNKLKKSPLFDMFKWAFDIRHKYNTYRHEAEALKRKEASDINPLYKKIKECKGIHAGEDCFIVATGPSLLLKDLEKLKNKYTFSMNSIIYLFDKTDWRPTYYALQDVHVYKHIKEKLDEYHLDNMFIADCMLQYFSFNTDDVIVYPLNHLNHFCNRKKKYEVRFSEDCYVDVYDGASVAFSELQIAVYMGFKKIYLIGADCDYSGAKQHVVDAYRSIDPVKQLMIAYEKAKEYADAHDVNIYNATRGGKLEIFERVDFDDLMERM